MRRSSLPGVRPGSLIYGVGINDADYIVNPTINNKRVMCPFYMKWNHMMMRCYNKKWQSSHLSYIGCSVVEDWHLFSNFKAWMESQDWEGKHLDKDLKVFGNKVYSPDTCTFIPPFINTCINTPLMGKCKQGVTYYRKINSPNKYITKIRKYGKHYNSGQKQSCKSRFV